MSFEQWWTDQRIERTVTQDFVAGSLEPKQRRVLKARVFDDDLSDSTYQDVILNKGRRCFLILRDIGHAELIFDLIDKNFTDEDLPIAGRDEAAWKSIASIRPRLDAKFDSRQYFYCLKELDFGRHIDYLRDEVVPSTTIEKGITRGSSTVKKVVIAKKTLLRRKYALDAYTKDGDIAVDTRAFRYYFSELGLLQHSHITRIWTTYTHDRHGYILLEPPSTLALKDVLVDSAKFFKGHSKPDQRQILLRWTLCMASAVDYLHQQGLSHQAIRPGNIYLDGSLNLVLGESNAFENFGNEQVEGHERLQYLHGSPEQWQRRRQVVNAAVPIQARAPSGSRSARPNPVTPQVPRLTTALFKRGQPKVAAAEAEGDRPLSPLGTVPAVTTFLRPSSSQTQGSDGSSGNSNSSTTGGPVSARPSQRAGHSRMSSGQDGVYENPTRPRRTMVAALNFARLATSSSDQSPLFPSDVFAMTTILIEILTTLLSTSSSNFSYSKLISHLGKRNRSAGRGGAPVDTSFHANLDQVFSYIDQLSKGVTDILHKEVKSRAKNKSKDLGNGDETHWLHAAAEFIEVVRAGIEPDPRQRITAAEYYAEMVRINERYALNPGQCCHAQAPAFALSSTKTHTFTHPGPASERASVSTSQSAPSHLPVIEGINPARFRGSSAAEPSSSPDYASSTSSPPRRPLPRVPELPGDDECSPISPQSPGSLTELAHLRIDPRDRSYAGPQHGHYYELPSPDPLGPQQPPHADRDGRADEEIEPDDSIYEYFSDEDEAPAAEAAGGSPEKRGGGHRAKVPSLRDIPLPAAWKEKQDLAFGTEGRLRYGSIGRAI